MPTATGNGRVLVFSGRDGTLIHSLQGVSSFGREIGSVGDFDLDGRTDFCVTSSGDTAVYSGRAAAPPSGSRRG